MTRSRSARTGVLVLAVALLGLGAYLVTRGGAARGSAAPAATAAPAPSGGGYVDRQAATPALALPPRVRSAAPAAADARPGATAFREYTDDFVHLNAEATREHMAKEGITLDETKELTFFALAALESQDWDVVEDLTGHPIEAEARRQVGSEMRRRSQQMRDELQTQVKAGAPVEERWATIQRIEAAYLAEYYVITGMTPELYDQLLAQSAATNHVGETAAAVAPGGSGGASHPAPPGTKCMKRDPANPTAPPVPIACP